MAEADQAGHAPLEKRVLLNVCEQLLTGAEGQAIGYLHVPYRPSRCW